MLSLVEAILENPRPVLFAQLAQLKGETIEALKAGLALADAAGVKLVFASQIVR